jgi:hypothetical protein
MNKQESSLRLIVSDDELAERAIDYDLETVLESGLKRLQSACTARRRADRGLEIATCNLAVSIANMVVQAELINVRLPRGYAARFASGESYLVKLPALDIGTYITVPDNVEPLFVLARHDSMVTRVEPAARRITYAQIMHFSADLEEGLIDEIADFIEHCNIREERAAICLNRIAVKSEGEPETKPRCYAALGRGRRTRHLPAQASEFSLTV